MRKFLVLVVLLIGFCCGELRAQSTNASVTGYITDPTKAVIVGAKVIVINVGTNIRYEATTNSVGSYDVTNLPPGPYRIEVEKPGFKTVVKSDVILHVQDTAAINFEMALGSASEIVTVTAGGQVMNTTDATVSTVVDRKFAEELPLNGRSFQTLIQLTPGVVLTTASTGDFGQFAVNGQRAASNYWMVDGVSGNIGAGNARNDQGEGTAGGLPGFGVQGGTNSLVSVDALQEFRIQTSTYAPEFGRTPGGQISIVTRSGTNQFHGTAFDYLRNDILDANDWFANFAKQRKPPERQNDFGGTFSGPMLKDKTFFFFSYEGLRLRLPTVGLTSVPTNAARQAAITATQPLLNAFPLPNGADHGNGTAELDKSFSNSSTLNATSLRIDHRVNEKLTLFGRYNYSPSELLSRPGGIFSLANLQDTKNTIQTTTVGATWNLAPAITNDLRFNYSRSASGASFSLDNFGGAVPLSVSDLHLPSPFTPQNSLFELVIFSPFLLVFDGTSGSFLQQQYNLVDNLSMQKSSHSLKLGVDYRRLNPSHTSVVYLQQPLFLDLASTESGQLFGTSLRSSRDLAFTFQNLGIFAQDTWRISPRLTLTYGLRWDLDFVPDGNPAFATVTNFNINNLSTVALAPPGTPPYRTTYGNLAPRVGGAYQLSRKQDRETVFRGGFGVFYDLASQQLGNEINTSRYPYGAFAFISGGTYPDSSRLGPVPIVLGAPGMQTFDPNLKLPYTLEWSVALEQALGAQQTISTSYIGSTGRRLLVSGRIFAPNQTFSQINFVTNGATSDYHALQVQFQRRLSHRLQALASYTWSHSIDTASAGSLLGGNFGNDFVPGINPNANRGPSDFDIRDTFSAAITYDVPVPKINAFTKAVLGGWSVQSIIQARSAPPVNAFYSSFALSPTLFGAAAAIRPDAVPGQPLYIYGAQCASTLQALGELASGQGCPGGKGFNPNAFVRPPLDANGNPVRQGNLPRNKLRGFGATQWDFAVHRDFPIRESLKLQFRAEMFNVLNHPNFGSPSGDLDSSQFGYSTQMLGQSLGGSGFGGLDALYQIGGPRSIQLALKILF